MITSNITNLTRTSVWSNELKEVLLDELTGQGHVRWLPFEGGNSTLNIPSIGEGTARNYVEDTPVVYDSLDTGNFQFSITEYLQSGNYITEKARQDLFYASQLEAAFVPKQARAIAERLETDIYKLALGGASGGQTVSDLNAINGYGHRWVGAGADNGTNQFQIGLADFSRSLFALKKANVPSQSLIAIVDPSVEYTINNLSNLISPASTTSPMWGDLLTTGIGTGPRFLRNIFGFDIYVSNYLCGAGAAGAGAETINSRVMASGGVCNIMFSAADQTLLPFVGSWGQMPKVDGEYNKDFQREEYVTTCRYGLKVYRPENLIVVISNTAVVA
jgi:hypothetical protein